MEVRAVIFDFDQVLIDSYNDHVDSFVIAAEKSGMKLNHNQIRKIYHEFGKSANEIMKEIYPKITARELKKFTTERDVVYKSIVEKNGIKLMKGAKEFLSFLAKKKLKIALVSSGSRKNIDLGFRKTGIGKFFDLVISSEDTRLHKPHPDPLIKAAKILKVNAKQCLYIGDSIYEIISARRARMNGVGVATGEYPQSALERNGAVKVFKNLVEFRKNFEKLLTL